VTPLRQHLERKGQNPLTRIPATTTTTMASATTVPFMPLWQRLWGAAIPERVSGYLWVKGLVGWGGTCAMTPNRHGVSQRATTQRPNAEALLTQLGLCSKPAVELDAPFPALEGGGGEATPGLPVQGIAG
jgi:hypothetical protein